MKKWILFAGLFLSGTFLAAQNDSSHKVRWYSLEEAQKLAQENPRPVFVDVYTDWCGWCKKMDRETFSDEAIASYLNKNYYPVKFDAESSEPVEFQGRVFRNRDKTHDLAIALLQGQLGYPSVVFINKELLVVQAVQGYRSAGDMKPILEYFAEEAYESGTTLQEYQKSRKKN